MPSPAAFVESTLQLLEKLIAFDSVSSQSNHPLIEWIESYLDSHNIWHARVPAPGGVSKTNLLARIGPEAEGGIVLSGHTDVVPVFGQPWETDPFVLTKKGTRLYGRGTSDMKTFLAVCLALAPHWSSLKLTRPFWFAFSYDEEVGCLGVPHLLAHIDKHIPKPAFALIGEPTSLQVVTAHKGVLSFETKVHGLEAHSSQPGKGVNAVQYAAKLVHFLSDLCDELALSGAQDARFDPPHTTVHVGTLHGGTARNIIPLEASFHWEIRPLPTDNADAIFERFKHFSAQLETKMKAVHPECGITTRPISRMTGVTLPDHAAPHCADIMRLAKTNAQLSVSFGTEAGVFNDHGIPAIICGPGDIAQAHKPNEFIEIAQIEACVQMMLQLPTEARMITS